MKKFTKIFFMICMLVVTGAFFAACKAPAIQTIDITNIPQYVYVGEEFTLVASLTPKKATQKDVLWQSSDKTVAEINTNGKVTPKKVGTVIITAMSKRNSAIKDSVQITVNSKSTDIILNDLTVTYDGNQKSVTAQNIPMGMTLTYKYIGQNYPESEVAPTNAGIYTVNAYQENSNIILATCVLRINQRTAVIKIDNKTKVFGAKDPDYTSTIEGLIADDVINYTISRTKDSENVGTYVLTANYEQNPNYNVQVVEGELKITPLDVRITAEEKTSVYGDALVGLTFQIRDVAGNVLDNIDKTNVSGSLKIITNGDLSRLNAGNYTISCEDLTSNNLNIRDKVNATYTITKRTAEVNVSAGQGKFAGDSDPELEKIISNTVEGDDLSNCLSRESGETVGTYNYILNQSLNENYILKFFNPDIKFTIWTNKVIISIESFSTPYDASKNPDIIENKDLKYMININGVQTAATMDNNGYIMLKGQERALPNYTLSQVASLNSIEQETIYQKWKITPSIVSLENVTDDKKYEFEFEETYKYITKITLTLTAQNAEKFYKDDTPTLTISTEGLVSGDTLIGVLDFDDNDATTEEKLASLLQVNGVSNNNADVGEYPITFDTSKLKLKQDKSYYKIQTINGILTINKRIVYLKPLDYTEENGNAVYYGEGEKALKWDTTNANLPQGVSVNDVLSKFTFSRTPGSDVGTYQISVLDMSVKDNYEVEFTPGIYQIVPRPLIVIARDTTISYGDSIRNLLYTYTIYTGEDGSKDYVLSERPVFSGSLNLVKTVAVMYVGEYEIGQGNLTAGSNFEIQFKSGTLTVNKRAVTMSFTPQTYAYGSEQPKAVVTFSPSLANSDTIVESKFIYSLDNSLDAKVYKLAYINGEYDYQLEIVTASNKVVYSTYNPSNNCYDIIINEQAIDVLYVGSAVLDVSITNKQDSSSNNAIVTYGDEFNFSDLYEVNIIGESDYTLSYTDASFNLIGGLYDAGVYTVTVVTNPSNENSVKIMQGETDVSNNFVINVKVMATLSIQKANLTLQTVPTVDDMPYGTSKPTIHDGVYTFFNARTGQTEIFVSSEEDYNLGDYSSNEVNEVGYQIYTIYTPKDNADFKGSNFNNYIHQDLILKIIKQEKDTASFTWQYGVSFEQDGTQSNNTESQLLIDVSFDAETSHNEYDGLYTTPNSLIVSNELKNDIRVSYVYYGISYSSLADSLGKLPYKNSDSDFGYVYCKDNTSFRATKTITTIGGESTTTISIYYIDGDKEYLLDNDFLEVSSSSPIKAGIYYVTAHISTTNGNISFSQTDFSCLYLVKKAEPLIMGFNKVFTYNQNEELTISYITDPDGLEGKVLQYYKVEGDLDVALGTDEDGNLIVPKNVGAYKVEFEIDSDNYYKKQTYDIYINPATLQVTFGTNTEINYSEDKYSCIDFVISANDEDLYTFVNNTHTGNSFIIPDELSWLDLSFVGTTRNGQAYESPNLPTNAGDYTLIIKTKEADASGLHNYTTPAGGIKKEFQIVPKFDDGGILFSNGTINYDSTYSTDEETGSQRMYEAICNAMLYIPEGSADKYILTLTVKDNNRDILIAPDQKDFVSIINRAGYTYNLSLSIDSVDGNTASTKKNASLYVDKATLPAFDRYSTTSTTLDYTGKRIFNALTATVNNQKVTYTPTIHNLDGSWTYAENGDANVYFGITYTYYIVQSVSIIDNPQKLNDAPISIDTIVQYMVIANINVGTNYQSPSILTYRGFFIVQKTTFSFVQDLSVINYTYGDSHEEITVQAKNSSNVSLELTYTDDENFDWDEEDGIVCYRYYTNNADPTRKISELSQETPTGTYTAHFKIISSKDNFNNSNVASDFETTRQFQIGQRQIHSCDTYVVYSSKTNGSDNIIYAGKVSVFGIKNTASLPADLKLNGITSTSYRFYFYDSKDSAPIISETSVQQMLNALEALPSGTYYYRLYIPSNNNYSISDFYEFEILPNEATISFKNGITQVTQNYVAGNNVFDAVTYINVRPTTIKDISQNDFIIRYRVYGSDDEFSTNTPSFVGEWEAEITYSTETYLSNTITIKFILIAPELQIISSNSNYTYKNYSTENFNLIASYNSEQIGTFPNTTSSDVWIFSYEDLYEQDGSLKTINIQYQNSDAEINIAQNIQSVLINKGLQLTKQSVFNTTSVGTLQIYVVYVSTNTNYSITVAQITVNISQLRVNVQDIQIVTGEEADKNLHFDEASEKFVYNQKLTTFAQYNNQENNWQFETIEKSSPTNTKLMLIGGGIDGSDIVLNVSLNYDYISYDNSVLSQCFTAQSDTYTTNYTLTSITEDSGNFDLSELLPLFEFNLIFTKSSFDNTYFTTSTQTVEYNTTSVNLGALSGSTNVLGFEDFVTINSDTFGNDQSVAYENFNKAYGEADKFNSFMTIKLYQGDTEIPLINGYEIEQGQPFGNYRIDITFAASKYFTSKTISAYYTINPQPIDVLFDSQVFNNSSSSIANSYLYINESQIDNKDYQLKVEIISTDDNSTIVYAYRVNYQYRLVLPDRYSTELISGSFDNLKISTNKIYKARVTLESLEDYDISNLSFENPIDNNSPLSTDKYLFYYATQVDLGNVDIYSSLDEDKILSSISSSYEQIDMGLSWPNLINSTLEQTNFMLTEEVLVSFELQKLNDSGEQITGSKTFDFSKLGADNGLDVVDVPIILTIGEETINTSIKFRVIFQPLLDVTNTTFEYNGTTQVPQYKVVISTFKCVYNIFEGGATNQYIRIYKDVALPTPPSVEYWKNNVQISNPTDAGNYEAVYSYEYNGKTYTQTVSFVINKVMLDIDMSSKTVNYNGNIQTLTATAEYNGQPIDCNITYSNESGNISPVNAGVYTATATIDNINFEGKATAILTINKLSTNIEIFEMSEDELVFKPNTEFIPEYAIYDDSGNDITSIVTATVTYKRGTSSNFDSNTPKNAGEYTMKITINENTNYFASSKEYSFIVTKANSVISYTLPSDLVYDGSPKAVSNIVINNQSVTSNYTVTYNGSTTAPSNVGIYKVVITYTPSTSSNYNSAKVETYMEITPKALEVTYTGYNSDVIEATYSSDLAINYQTNCEADLVVTGFTYNNDGTLSTSSQTFEYMPTLPGIYTATFTAKNSNYSGSVVTTIKINRASPTFGFTGATYTYDGSAQTPSVTGSLSDYTLSYLGTTFNGDSYSSNTAPIDAGIYTVTLTFAGNNAYLPTTQSFSFTISKATLEIVLQDLVATYDGTAKYPTAVASLKGEEIDGFEDIQFVFSDGTVAPVDSGKYKVYAYSTNNNYSGLSSDYIFTINPANLNITLVNNGDLVFGSADKVIESISPIVEYRVLYTGKTYLSDGTLSQENNYNSYLIPTTAGEYTGTVFTKNYKQTTFEFVIEKQAVTISLVDVTITSGQLLTFDSELEGKKVQYTFAADGSDEFSEVIPTDSGTYTIKASIIEQNYKGETTSTLTVLPINNTSTRIELDSKYFMYTGEAIVLEPKLYISNALHIATSTTYYFKEAGSWTIVSQVDQVGEYKVSMSSANATAELEFSVIPKINLSFPTNAIYSGEPYTISYTFDNVSQDTSNIRSKLSLSYEKDGKFVPNVKDAGLYTINLLYDNYVVKQQDFTVQKQTVTNLPTKDITITFGNSLPNIVAEHNVIYEYSTNGGTSFSAQVPSSGSGYKLRIIVDEDNYQGEVIVNFTINKKGVIFDLQDIECDYTGKAINLPIDYKDLTNIQYRYSTTEVGGYISGLPTNPGTYYVKASVSETNYELVYPNEEKQYILVTINKATPDYVIKDTTHTYDGTVKAITASAYINGTPLRLKIEYSEQNPTDAGDYEVTISVDGDTNYNSTTTTMTILKADPTISYNLSQTLVYDGELKNVTATSTSGEIVEITYMKDGIQTSPLNAGTYLVTFSCRENNNYNAMSITTSFNIEKARPTFTYSIPDISYLTYDGTAKSYDYSTDNDIATISVEYSQSNSIVTPINAGTYDVKFTITSINDNYTSFVYTTTMTIYKAMDQISYSLPTNMFSDGNSKALTNITSSSNTNVKQAYKVNGTTTNDFTKAGIYVATLSTDDSPNYFGTSITVTYVITKQLVDISISAPSDLYYDGNSHAIIISNNSVLSSGDYIVTYSGIMYNTSGELKDNYSSTSIAPTRAGNYTATLSFTNNNRYESTGVTTVSFTIKRVDLSIKISISDLNDDVTMVEFDESKTYTASGVLTTSIPDTLTLTPKITIDGATANEIKDGGVYDIVISVNNNNYIGYASRRLTISKQKAFIFLKSSAVEYGKQIGDIIPEYILKNANGDDITITNASNIITLYTLDGIKVTATKPDVGQYRLSLTVQTNGYYAVGSFPFEIVKATPKVYYNTGVTGEPYIDVSDAYTDQAFENFVVSNLVISIDGTTTITELGNMNIWITYDTINEEGEIVSETIYKNYGDDIVEYTDPLPARAYRIKISIVGNDRYQDREIDKILLIEDPEE